MADNRPLYDFTLPVEGVKLTWRPLTAGQEINIATTYRREEEQPLIPSLLIAARVLKFGDKQGMSLADIQALDSLDVEALQDEILTKEAERRAALRKTDIGAVPPVVAAKQAVVEAGRAFGHALSMLQKAVDLAEAAARSGSPLVK